MTTDMIDRTDPSTYARVNILTSKLCNIYRQFIIETYVLYSPIEWEVSRLCTKK